MRIAIAEAAGVPAVMARRGGSMGDRAAVSETDSQRGCFACCGTRASVGRRDADDLLHARRAARREREAGLSQRPHAGTTRESPELEGAGSGGQPLAKALAEREELVDGSPAAKTRSSAGSTARTPSRRERRADPSRRAQRSERQRVLARAGGSHDR